MGSPINIDDLTQLVADQLSKPKPVWEDYVPIIESESTMEVFLHEGINAPSIYSEMYYRIINVPSHKRVTLHINNGGGYEASSSTICQALRKCKAPVHGCLSGIVASAATIITMECDTIDIAHDAMFMVHESSFENAGGKFSDMKTFQTFYDKVTKSNSHRIYKGFLTPDEVDIIHTGKELWFDAEDVLQRWNNKKELANG